MSLQDFLARLVSPADPMQNPYANGSPLGQIAGLLANQNNPTQNLDHLSRLAYQNPELYAGAYGKAIGDRTDPYAEASQQANLSQIALNNEVQRARIGQLPLERLNLESQIRARNSDSATQLDKLQRQQRAQAILSGQAAPPGVIPLNPYASQSAGAYPMMVPSNPTDGGLSQLATAVRQVESGGNPNAVSPKGAQGLMQIMPDTAKNPGFGVTPLQNNSPEENVRFGTDYLSALVTKYGDPTKALAAYNAGPGAVDKALEKSPTNWLSLLPQETQSYVPKVLQSLPQAGLPSALPQQLPSALQQLGGLPQTAAPSPLPQAPVGQNLPSAPVQSTIQSAPVNSQALPQTMPFQTSGLPQFQYQPSEIVQRYAAAAQEDSSLAPEARQVAKEDYDRQLDQFKLQQAPALEAAKTIAGEQAKVDVGRGEQDKARSKFDETLQKIADNLQELDRRKAIASANDGEMGRLYVDQQPGFLSPFTPDLARKGTFGKELAKTQSIYDDNENLRQLALQQYKAATGTKSGEVNSISELQQVLKGLGDSKFSVEAQLKALQNASEAFGGGTVQGPAGNSAGSWSIKVK